MSFVNHQLILNITDTPAKRDLLFPELTSTKTFIRFVGNDLHPTDFHRIELWVEKLKKWCDHGAEEIYFFIHMQDERLGKDLIEKIHHSLPSHHLKEPVTHVHQGHFQMDFFT